MLTAFIHPKIPLIREIDGVASISLDGRNSLVSVAPVTMGGLVWHTSKTSVGRTRTWRMFRAAREVEITSLKDTDMDNGRQFFAVIYILSVARPPTLQPGILSPPRCRSNPCRSHTGSSGTYLAHVWTIITPITIQNRQPVALAVFRAIDVGSRHFMWR